MVLNSVPSGVPFLILELIPKENGSVSKYFFLKGEGLGQKSTEVHFQIVPFLFTRTFKIFVLMYRNRVSAEREIWRREFKGRFGELVET